MLLLLAPVTGLFLGWLAPVDADAETKPPPRGPWSCNPPVAPPDRPDSDGDDVVGATEVPAPAEAIVVDPDGGLTYDKTDKTWAWVGSRRFATRTLDEADAILVHTSAEPILAPLFAPDGRWITFLLRQDRGMLELMAWDRETQDLKRVDPGHQQGGMTWHPQGQLLVFQRGDALLRAAPPEWVPAPLDLRGLAPRFSSDGGQMVYAANTTVKSWRTNSGELEDLVTLKVPVAAPQLSPRGSKLGFFVDTTLHVAELSERKPVRLATDVYGFGWLDEFRVLHTQLEPGEEEEERPLSLWIRTLEGEGQLIAEDIDGRAFGPALSQDRKWTAWTSATPSSVVSLGETDGTRVVELVTPHAGASEPALWIGRERALLAYVGILYGTGTWGLFVTDVSDAVLPQEEAPEAR